MGKDILMVNPGMDFDSDFIPEDKEVSEDVKELIYAIIEFSKTKFNSDKEKTCDYIKDALNSKYGSNAELYDKFKQVSNTDVPTMMRDHIFL